MSKWPYIAAICITTLTMPAAAFDRPDPDEGGIGGTGNIDEPSAERPEIIERPERPERIEHIDRPEIERRPEGIEAGNSSTGDFSFDTPAPSD